ncbi:MAG: SAM-dependent chlorinase/fluorinase [Bacteroidetes bacterium]|nr:SAM-dependent chlorinase/fluorinase [Bacteroidota bacterium]
MATETRRILTLTSDFGNRDGYVAAMKGVILSIAPDVIIVDISHQITPQDVMEAAHVLSSAASCYPAGTVHLVVVDPGVGTDRRCVALEQGGHFYVGPDNGIFSLILKNSVPDRIIELDRPQFWRTPEPSKTFHGRDIFASVAGHLVSGRMLDELGSTVLDIRTMHWAMPISDDQGIQGWVVHVDGFGNCITNIVRAEFEELQRGRAFKCYVGNAILDGMQMTYSDTSPGDILVLFNSDDFLEVAINRGNASSMMDIKKGTSINVIFSGDK